MTFPSNSAGRRKIPARRTAAGTVVPFPVADTEVALVAALNAGRADARRALFERYGDDVERVLYRVLGPDPDIDDLLQDVFLVALTCLPRLRQPDKLRSWLIGIAVRKARKTIRQRRLWRFIQFKAPHDLPEQPAVTASQDISEALRVTYRILERLPVDDRVAFALRHVDGMELEALAEVTNVSLSTVKRRLARAHSAFVSLAQKHSALSEWLRPGSFLR